MTLALDAPARAEAASHSDAAAATRSLGPDRGEYRGRAGLRGGFAGAAVVCPQLRGQHQGGDFRRSPSFALMRLCFRADQRPAGAAAGGAADLHRRHADRRGLDRRVRVRRRPIGNCWFSASISGIGSTMFYVSALGLMIRISPPDARGRVAGLFSSAFWSARSAARCSAA